jgi:nucleoside-diphosphate-sugar epimerase
MVTPRILVTGGAGGTGLPVALWLQEKGFPVRATVRRRHARSSESERRGVEVVVADMYDPGQLHDSLRGT